MKIRFTRDRHDGDQHTMTCLRADGTHTLSQEGAAMVHHDLLHYAVETTMGWREAFYGLVAAGRDIDSFGTRDGVKDTYTTEASWAEGLVGALQWAALSNPPPTEAEWWEMWEAMRAGWGIVRLPVTPEQVHEARKTAADLHAAFAALAPGEALELEF